MSFDYSEFAKARKSFSRLTREFDNWICKFLLREGERFISNVKRRTPVDTGDLRNHWKLDGITRDGDTLKVWFVNSMEYASFVEYGHAKPYKSGAAPGSADWVEGYFMMTVSLDYIIRTMPNRFNSELGKFLKSLEVY